MADEGGHGPARGPRVVDARIGRRSTAARRGLGRAALHGRRARARPRGRRPRSRADEGNAARPMASPSDRPPTSTDSDPRRPRTATEAAAPDAPCSSCATACRRSSRPRQALAEVVRRHRGGHRPGRDRRRARLRLPLLRARLPRPAAPRGLRHRPGRPDRLRRPRRRCSERPRRHRVDPARRDPGPALPDRARPVPRPRCSTPSSPAGCSATRASAWPPWSRRCSGYRMAQGALGRRLVDASAARAVARVRRPRRRGARRAPRGARRRARRGRQGRLGRRGVRVAQDFTPADPRRPVAAYVGPAQGARPPGPGRRARAVDDARPDRRPSAT